MISPVVEVTKITQELGNRSLLLTRTEAAIEYFFIYHYLTTRSLVYIGTQRKLAKILTVHENSICNALNSFEERGWIRKNREGYNTVIEFTQLYSERLRRLSYCSSAISLSLVDVEYLNDLKIINENYRKKIAQFEAKKQKERELSEKYKRLEQTITENHLKEFVSSLSATLSNDFDKRSIMELVKGEILAFQKNFGQTQERSSSATIQDTTQILHERFLAKYKESMEKRNGE